MISVSAVARAAAEKQCSGARIRPDLAFYISAKSGPATRQLKFKGEILTVSDDPFIKAADVESIEQKKDGSKAKTESYFLTLTDSGRAKLAEVTRASYRSMLVVALGDEVVAAPTIHSEISDGHFVMTLPKSAAKNGSPNPFCKD